VQRQLTKANTKAEVPFQNQQQPLFVCDFMCVCVWVVFAVWRVQRSPIKGVSFNGSEINLYGAAVPIFCRRPEIKLMRGAQLRRVLYVLVCFVANGQSAEIALLLRIRKPSQRFDGR
jgi:hypothetical protein